MFSRKKDKDKFEKLELEIPKTDYADLERWAKEEGISVGDLITKGFVLYKTFRDYRDQGLHFATVNDAWEVQFRLKIPGITTLDSDPFAEEPPLNRLAFQPLSKNAKL